MIGPRRVSVIAALVAAGIGFAACDDPPPPKSGYVKKLDFHDRWTEEIWSTVCVAYGQYGCTVSVPVVTGHIDHPAEWCLLIADDKDKKHEGDVCMDPATYAKYQPGMHYPDAR